MKVDFWASILLVRKQYAAAIEQVSQRHGLTRAEMDVLLFLGGVVITILGVIGEYLAKIYMEVKHRPIFLERESNVDEAPEE